MAALKISDFVMDNCPSDRLFQYNLSDSASNISGENSH